MAVNNVDISTNERLQLNEESINSGTIDRKFGRSEDYIELHIYNQDDQLLTSDYNFTQYKFPEGNTENLVSELNMDPVKVLRTKGYTTGKYKLVFNIQRSKIFDTSTFPFSIKEISSTRRELKSVTPKIINTQLDTEASRFIREIEAAPYLVDFVLNFNNDINITGINLALNKNTNKHELLIKLIDPLPSNIKVTDSFKIVEEITDPIVLNVDLGLESTKDEGIPLQGPNFKIDVRLNNSVPSSFKNYDEILDYSLTSSYHNLLNYLENREIPDVSYDFIRTVSGSNEGDPLEEAYHFENFTHFSSAVERLKNFEYKIQLIELYDSQTSDINSITGDTATAPYVLENKEEINKKKQNLIKGFDGYERFLYYTSGTFAWPKQNSTPPYNLFPISSSEVKTWLGSEMDTFPNYGGQLLSASLFDRQNENALTRLVPNHIMDNPDNSFYSSFVNMVGQHFDQIWVHIKHLTEVNDAHHTRGISKELVYFSLKSLGLETFDQFENSNLIEYILGEGTSGSVYYDTPQSQSIVTASVGSIPKSDITKNIWKRLYHNAPYLLKTKGTERGLRALMSCYGVPSTILNVKEYGGSTSDRTTYKTFTNDKGSLALKGDSGINGYFIKTNWNSSLTHPLSASAKTVEFRIKPHRSDEKYHLFSLSGSNLVNNHHLILEPHTGDDISSSLDSDQYGRLKYIIEVDGQQQQHTVTEKFPVYNGDFWNIFVGTEIENPDTINNDGTNIYAPIKFGAYQSNHLKSCNFVSTTTENDIGSMNSNINTVFNAASAWGLEYRGANNSRRLGASFCYIGGLPQGGSSGTTTSLRYSGSLQEVRYHFGELLSHETLKKHALEPFMYSGNTPSSSYENLVLRLPLGSNDKRVVDESFHPNIDVSYLAGYQGAKLLLNQTNDDHITTTLESSYHTLGLGNTNYIANNIHKTVDGISRPGERANGTEIYGVGEYGIEFFHGIETPDLPNPPNLNHIDGTITYDIGTMIGYNPKVNRIIFDFRTNRDDNSERYAHRRVEVQGSNNGTDFDFIALEDLQPRGAALRTFTFTNNTAYRYYRLKFGNYFWDPGDAVQYESQYAKGLAISEISFFTSSPEGGEEIINNAVDSQMTTQTFEEVVEEHYTPTPDTVGISTTSEKTRIETGTIDDDWLSPTRKTETSTLDNQPPDYEDLGVFFSPTNELNEDIIYTLGAFRLDDYIGSPLPSVQIASEYEDLKDIKNIYFKKVERRYNYWDYIKLIQYIDHTLFKLVEQFVPMKANLKTGLLIEPHYLERTKFARELPVIDDDQTMTVGSYNTINSEIEPNRFFNLTGSAVITTNNPINTSKVTVPSKIVVTDQTSFTEVPLDSSNFNFHFVSNANKVTISNIGNINSTSGTTVLTVDDEGSGLGFPGVTGNVQLICTFPEPQVITKIIVDFSTTGINFSAVFFYTQFDLGDGSSDAIAANDPYKLKGPNAGHSVGGVSANNSNDQSITFFNYSNVGKVKAIRFAAEGYHPTLTDSVTIDHIQFFTSPFQATNPIFSLGKKDQGTNFTIDIDDYILDETQEAAQAPIKPYTGTQPEGYVARKSSTLLGNAVKGRISSRYYRQRSGINNKETEY